jgi:carboxyl-terminal processing protease
MVVLLTAATIVLSYAHYFIYDPHVTPVELYHNTWRVAKDNIYDQSKLKDWSDWEHKFDSQIKTEEDALRFSEQLVEHLNEKYTGLLTASVVERDKERADGHYIGIGVELGARGSQLTLKRVTDGGPADKAGLKAGDEFVSVDGKDVSTWDIAKMSEALKGEEGQTVSLTMRRDGKEFSVSIARGKIATPIVKTLEFGIDAGLKPGQKRLTGKRFQLTPIDSSGTKDAAGAVGLNAGSPTDSVNAAPAAATGSRVGYLRIESFDQWSVHEQVREAMEKLSGSDALVIDLRDNPGGFVHEAVRTAALFMDEGTVTNINLRLPAAGYMMTHVTITPRQILLKSDYGPVKSFPVPMLHRPPNLLKGRPVVLLVNGNSASAAEMFAAALIDNGIATAVGTTTFGKGIGQTYLPVGNGHKLRITHLHAFTPAGTFLGDAGQTISNGIKPVTRLEKVGYGAYGSATDNQFQEAVRILERKLDAKP